MTDQVLSNLSNYKSFGFTKFIPRASQESFEAVVRNSPNSSSALPQWNKVSLDVSCYTPRPMLTISPCQLKDSIYALEPESSLSIGKRSEGHVSNYYLGEPITDDEVAAVQAAAEKLGVDVLNTRYALEFTTKPCILNGCPQCPQDGFQELRTSGGVSERTSSSLPQHRRQGCLCHLVCAIWRLRVQSCEIRSCLAGGRCRLCQQACSS